MWPSRPAVHDGQIPAAAGRNHLVDLPEGIPAVDDDRFAVRNGRCQQCPKGCYLLMARRQVSIEIESGLADCPRPRDEFQNPVAFRVPPVGVIRVQTDGGHHSWLEVFGQLQGGHRCRQIHSGNDDPIDVGGPGEHGFGRFVEELQVAM